MWNAKSNLTMFFKKMEISYPEHHPPPQLQQRHLQCPQDSTETGTATVNVTRVQ